MHARGGVRPRLRPVVHTRPRGRGRDGGGVHHGHANDTADTHVVTRESRVRVGG